MKSPETQLRFKYCEIGFGMGGLSAHCTVTTTQGEETLHDTLDRQTTYKYEYFVLLTAGQVREVTK